MNQEQKSKWVVDHLLSFGYNIEYTSMFLSHYGVDESYYIVETTIELMEDLRLEPENIDENL